jgi:hypothetical protein
MCTVTYDQPVITAAIAALPQLGSVGAVKDLHSEAATDPVLAAKLQALSGITLADLSTYFDRVEDIMARWHNVNPSLANPRGSFVDREHIQVYESLDDTPFRQWSGPNPRPQAGAMIYPCTGALC